MYLALPSLLVVAGCSREAPDPLTLTGPSSVVSPQAQRASVERGRFTAFPAPLPVDAPCVDSENPITMIGPWSGWYQRAQTPGGHVHRTEHIDWSGVTLEAMDGRTWTPGPGAHESFSFNQPATPGDLGESAYTVTHNLRARFLSQDGDSDLQVWHTIQIVRGPDLEFKVFKVVLPFRAFCIGPQ
jgi:hypothetical protein